MKKLTKKPLALQHETIRALSRETLQGIAGGLARISKFSCEGEDCYSYMPACSGTCA
jgi:hypothetical protein